MTPEAQRIAIAKACGWKREPLYDDEPNGRKAYRHDDRRVVYFRDLPDYLNDLNAMHEAEKTLDRIKQDEIERTEYDRYWQWLRATASGDYVGATAAQRAEAFLRTKGLLKQSS